MICLLKMLNGENTSFQSDFYHFQVNMSYLHHYIIGYRHYRFKRLTGRNEVAVSARDYKFYCPRHKHRRIQNSVSSIHGLPVRPINTLFIVFSELEEQVTVYLFGLIFVLQTFPGIDSSSLANTQGFRSVSEVRAYSFQIYTQCHRIS